MRILRLHIRKFEGRGPESPQNVLQYVQLVLIQQTKTNEMIYEINCATTFPFHRSTTSPSQYRHSLYY